MRQRVFSVIAVTRDGIWFRQFTLREHAEAVRDFLVECGTPARIIAE
jgi:hypothetical protein